MSDAPKPTGPFHPRPNDMKCWAVKDGATEPERRVAQLEVALRSIAAPTYGTELGDSDAERAQVYWSHLARFQRIARDALSAGAKHGDKA